MNKVVNSIIIIALWLGVRSLGHFIILYVGLPIQSIIVIDVLSLILVIVLSKQALFTTSVSSGTKPSRNLHYLLLLTIISASVLFVIMTISRPYGLGDAIAIWNLRARYLYYAGLDFDITFSPILEFSHVDYPLLIPLTVMRTWELLGYYHPITPAIIAAFYTLGTATLLFYIVEKISGRILATLSIISLLILPNYIRWGAGQMADIPLAFYMLLSVSLIIIWRDTSSQNSNTLYLLGLALGCASWVKNEGLLFVVAFYVVSLLILKPRLSIKHSLQIAMTLIPFLIVNALLKSSIAVTNDLISGQGSQTLAHLFDLSRYVTIMVAYVIKGLPYITLLLLMITYETKVLNFKIAKPNTFISILIGLVLLGYFGVFVTTPSPLDWHLETALERLLMQVYPMAILMVASMFSLSMPKSIS